jgi:hypothetical protein
VGDLGQIFFLSLLAMFNPTLLAAVTLMLLTEHPKRLMLGYLLGAYTTSITLGLAIVFALHDSDAVSTSKRTIGPGEDIIIGCLLLLIAYVLGSDRDARLRERRTRRKEAKLAKEGPRLAADRVRRRHAAQFPRHLLPDRAQPHRQARRRGGADRAAGRRFLPDPAAAARGAPGRLRTQAGGDPARRRWLPRLAGSQRPPCRHLGRHRAGRPPGHSRNRRAGELG